ncbi:MAG: hypothetical protein LUC91_01245 [Prevotella sp.]|nr:hypothetical protein [Prevotella sp.]
MRNTYMTCIDETEAGRKYAYVLRVEESSNLLFAIKRRPNLKQVSILAKDKALALANFLNKTYFEHGSYMFDELEAAEVFMA